MSVNWSPPALRIGWWMLCLVFPFVMYGQREDVASEQNPPPRRAGNDAGRTPISLDGGESINPTVVAAVRDDTLGLTDDDREAYYRILKLTQKLDPAELRDMARDFRQERHAASKYRERPFSKFPVFVDLFQHPGRYRGRPVTLHGKLRRLISYDAGKNDQGLERLYEGWFFADDSQENPSVVITTQIPQGLPTGADIEEEVSFTGYFLKMYGYSAQDTTRRAPLFLAKSFTWRPNIPRQRWNPAPTVYLALTAGVGLIALLVAVLVRENRRKRERMKQRFAPSSANLNWEGELRPGKFSEPGRNGTPVEPHH